MKVLVDFFKSRAWHLGALALLIYLGNLAVSPAVAVYTSHLQTDQAYRTAAEVHESVVHVQGKEAGKLPHVFGSGVLIRDPKTKQIYLLTAAHVLQSTPFHEIIFKGQPYVLEKMTYFHDFLLSDFPDNTILVAKDLHTSRRLFVLRLKEDKERLKEACVSYGVDLGLARVKGLPDPDNIKTYDFHEIAATEQDRKNSWARWRLEEKQALEKQEKKGQKSLVLEKKVRSSPLPPPPERSQVIGFGESGSGIDFGRGFPCWVRGAGTKRAFETVLNPRYQFTLLNGNTMDLEAEFYTYSSFFQPGQGSLLSGHIGPGDSGGPALVKGSEEIMAISSGGISKGKQDSIDADSWWQALIRRAGKIAGHHSPLSYCLWQEANVYGSEALYAGVTTPVIHRWIHESMQGLNHSAETE